MENQWFGAVRGFPMLIDGRCTHVVCQDTVKLGQENIVIYIFATFCNYCPGEGLFSLYISLLIL